MLLKTCTCTQTRRNSVAYPKLEASFHAYCRNEEATLHTLGTWVELLWVQRITLLSDVAEYDGDLLCCFLLPGLSINRPNKFLW